MKAYEMFDYEAQKALSKPLFEFNQTVWDHDYETQKAL